MKQFKTPGVNYNRYGRCRPKRNQDEKKAELVNSILENKSIDLKKEILSYQEYLPAKYLEDKPVVKKSSILEVETPDLLDPVYNLETLVGFIHVNVGGCRIRIKKAILLLGSFLESKGIDTGPYLKRKYGKNE